MDEGQGTGLAMTPAKLGRPLRPGVPPLRVPTQGRKTRFVQALSREGRVRGLPVRCTTGQEVDGITPALP
jgi:hypothetical protein